MYFDINSVITGEYHPGAFILCIDKEFRDEMEYDSFSKEEMATFVHEYIHYLQDISTVRGLTLFEHQAKLFQLNIAVSVSKDSCRFPIDLEKENADAYIKSELLSFFEGGNLEKKIHHINKIVAENDDIIDEILNLSSHYKGTQFKQISIYYDDKSDPTPFGFHYIIESMAYLIERYCFCAEERTREFPYNAVEMVCSRIAPDLLEHPECMIMICEVSLMYENSGFVFYQILERLKKEGIDYSKPHVLRKYLNPFMCIGVKNLKHINQQIKENIDFLFPTTNRYMQMANIYVKNIFDSACSFRARYPFFIADIVQEKSPIERIKYWFSLFPAPLQVDNINKKIYGTFEGLELLPVPFSLLKYFQLPQYGCQLINYCKYSKLENVDEDICEKMPWKQCDKTYSCPFALYFKIYKLDKKEIML